MSLTDEQDRMLREVHAALCKPRASSQPSAPPRVTVAKHDPNDPVVKLLPKHWKGEDLRGRRYSECPPNFLGMLAHMLDAFADKNEEDGDPQKQRYAKWDRENAETARKWRAKLGATDVVNGKATQQELDEAF